MINSVKNSDKPTSTILGGACAVPMAWRRKPKTMMSRAKEVIIKKTEGSIDKNAKMKMTSTGPRFPAVSPEETLMEKSAAWAVTPKTRAESSVKMPDKSSVRFVRRKSFSCFSLRFAR